MPIARDLSIHQPRSRRHTLQRPHRVFDHFDGATVPPVAKRSSTMRTRTCLMASGRACRGYPHCILFRSQQRWLHVVLTRLYEQAQNPIPNSKATGHPMMNPRASDQRSCQFSYPLRIERFHVNRITISIKHLPSRGWYHGSRTPFLW